MQRVLSDLRSLVRPRNVNSTVYSVLTAAFLGVGAACIWAPPELLTGILAHANTPDAILLWRSISAALLVLPSWSVTLKVSTAQLADELSRMPNPTRSMSTDTDSYSNPSRQPVQVHILSFMKHRRAQRGFRDAVSLLDGRMEDASYLSKEWEFSQGGMLWRRKQLTRGRPLCRSTRC